MRSRVYLLAFVFCAGVVLLWIGYHRKQVGDATTAGGQTAPPLFRDVTEAAGVRYAWVIPDKRPLNILQTIGNGCAFLDYDHDGNLDILLVGPQLALYKGDGKGHFADVTHQAGLDTLHGHFLGCAVGDYDNDGFPDIYLTAYRGGVLLHNAKGTEGVQVFRSSGIQDKADAGNRELGTGNRTNPKSQYPTPNTQHPTPEHLNTRTPEHLNARTPEHPTSRLFREVTQAAGITPQPWGTSATFIETVSGSGRLDLVVANYARFGNEPGISQLCEQKSVHGGVIMTSCGPRHYTPLKAVLFRNRGNGGFAPPVTLSMVSGRSLGVAGCDYDGSGRQGIAFANDETTGDLLQNKGQGNFENVGTVSGTAYDRDGNIHGGMGVDWGDYDNDGRFDLLVATFQNEPKSLYHNVGGGNFTDVAYPSGIGSATRASVAFGCKFLDYDNDGWLDAVIANGHVQDNIAEIDSSTTYRQTFQLLHNKGPGEGARVTFEEVSHQAGADLGRKIVGRGLATGDYDNDGRIDLLLVDSEGKPLLLHNETGNREQGTGNSPNTQPPTPNTSSHNHWLGLRLIGSRSNRDGYGAIVTVQVGGRALVRHCHADGSYMSSSDPRVHFGLGSASKVEALTIRWPSGQVEPLTSPPVDRYLTIREGQGIQP